MPVWTAEGTVNLPVENMAVDTVKTTPFERRFNPYDFNGGSVPVIVMKGISLHFFVVLEP